MTSTKNKNAYDESEKRELIRRKQEPASAATLTGQMFRRHNLNLFMYQLKTITNV
ncbi:hypothetical protein [Proteiniphilum sp. UBA5384]|uniref:hypothetical protein n=1 Tax=Proteiniphilum sp. UBA5384 TaxID=1947279 RepID=UPI0025DEC007|nr:hypothetical protein [Proteiniphilum sp. UBA5384]